MKRRNAQFVFVIAGISILLLMILYANPQRFAQVIVGSDYRFVLAAFLLSTLNFFLRTLKWKVLLNDVKLSRLMPVQMLGLAVSNFSPGKVAEPVKSVILKMSDGVPVSASLPSVVWERIIDVTVLLLLSAMGIILFVHLGGGLFLVSLAGFAIFIALIIFGVLFLKNEKFRGRVFRLLKRLPVSNRLSENFIRTFGKGHPSLARLSFSFAATLSAWLIEGVIIYLCFLSIGVSLSPLVLASMFALATIIGIITALPGGIGSTDFVMVLFLSSAGVGNAIAITGFLLSRFVSLWYGNLAGGISLFYFMKKSSLDFREVFK